MKILNNLPRKAGEVLLVRLRASSFHRRLASLNSVIDAPSLRSLGDLAHAHCPHNHNHEVVGDIGVQNRPKQLELLRVVPDPQTDLT